MKLIGIEIRATDAQTGRTIEIALLPMSVNLPFSQAGWMFPCTIHTDQGDLSISGNNGNGMIFYDAGMGTSDPGAKLINDQVPNV